jgi:NAD(P) transhydrogenase
VTKRMLDMFKRKTDAPEYNYLYGLGGASMLASLYAAHKVGVPHVYSMGYLASSICCLGAISGLSN